MESLLTEIELIEASLLPVESLNTSSRDAFPIVLEVQSSESKLRLLVGITESYPSRYAVHIEVKGENVGREEAEEWREKVETMMQDWEDESETPLYTIMTAHFLPILSSPSPSPPPSLAPIPPKPSIPHHALIKTHHLLSPTKRKLLIQLSSELNLIGFSKTGHPGIMYAIGEKEDIEEWLVQVKSWNWLALKVRITCEPDPWYTPKSEGLGRVDETEGKHENGVGEGGKARGDWIELEKLSDALEWMRSRGKEKLLIDAGVGSSN